MLMQQRHKLQKDTQLEASLSSEQGLPKEG